MWITGQVVDVCGRALSGVSIQASGSGTPGPRTVVTNLQGHYVLQDLRAGVYRITFARAGFSTVERTISALTSYVATINARLDQKEGS